MTEIPYIVPSTDSGQTVDDNDVTYFARPGSAIPIVVSMGRMKTLLGGSDDMALVPSVVADPRRIAWFETEPDLAAGMAATWPDSIDTWDGLIVAENPFASGWLGVLVAGGVADGWTFGASGAWSPVGWDFVGDIALASVDYRFYRTSYDSTGEFLVGQPVLVWRVVTL